MARLSINNIYRVYSKLVFSYTVGQVRLFSHVQITMLFYVILIEVHHLPHRAIVGGSIKCIIYVGVYLL